MADAEMRHVTVSLHPTDRAMLARAAALLIARGKGSPIGDSVALLQGVEKLILNGWEEPAASVPESAEGSGQ